MSVDFDASGAPPCLLPIGAPPASVLVFRVMHCTVRGGPGRHKPRVGGRSPGRCASTRALMRWIVGMVLIASFAGHAAEAPDGGVAPGADGGTPDDEELRKELEQSLQQDAAAKDAAQQGAGAAAPSGATAPASGGPQGTAARGPQSLNPDISAILDANAGYERRGVAYRNGDDPDLHGGPNTRGAGFTAQEVELALSAIVDPYFRGDIFLTIPNLDGLEVEEAFATTTSLPHSLQLKAGSFRSAYGRQNGQHLHVQDFTRRPLVNAAFLGEDGLRGPGVQVSWLAPLPFFLTLSGEALSLRSDPADQSGAIPQPVASFGSDASARPTLAAEAKAFFPLGEAWSLYSGLSFASGKSAGFLLADGTPSGVGRE